MLVEPTPIKGVKKMSVVIANPNQQTGFILRYDPYIIEVDYSRNCRNRKIVGQEKRLEYRAIQTVKII